MGDPRLDESIIGIGSVVNWTTRGCIPSAESAGHDAIAIETVRFCRIYLAL